MLVVQTEFPASEFTRSGSLRRYRLPFASAVFLVKYYQQRLGRSESEMILAAVKPDAETLTRCRIIYPGISASCDAARENNVRLTGFAQMAVGKKEVLGLVIANIAVLKQESVR